MSLVSKISHSHISKTAIAIIAVLGLYVGGYATLYRMSDANVLQQHAQKWLSGTDRTLNFDADVGRRLFPRPTVIIRNAVLSEMDGTTPAMKVREMRVGIAWTSLWGEPTVEKLVLNDPEVQFSRDASGYWNISDLWRTSDKRTIVFNRVQLHNGTLILRDEQLGSLKLGQMNLAVSRLGENLSYVLSANSQSPYWETLTLNAKGNAQTASGSLKLPDVYMQFNGKENGYTFSGSLKTDAQWQGEDFMADNTRLEMASHRYNSTFNATVNKFNSRHGNANLTGINAVFTAPNAHYQPNGTLSAAQVSWRDYHLHSSEVNLGFTARSLDSIFDASVKANADWSMQAGAQFHNAKIVTLQTPTQGLPRFSSEWEGSLNAPTPTLWQVNLQGLFDRQPSTIDLRREGSIVSGSLKFSKLNINNYLSHLDDSIPNINLFPKQDVSWKIGLDINTLETPAARVDNIHADIHVDSKRALFKPLSADLYSGHTTGSLLISNTAPMNYHLQQKAQDVQIRPLIQDLLKISRITGKGTAEFDLKTSGNTHQEMLSQLNGKVNLDINDGELSGLSLARLRNILVGSPIGQGDSVDDTEQTMPFAHFVLNANIKNGVSRHQAQADLVSPTATMNSKGEMDFANARILEDIVFQGADSSIPLPIRVSGDIVKPAVSLNYQQITSGITSPEERKQAVSDALKQQWQWFLKQPQTAASQPAF